MRLIIAGMLFFMVSMAFGDSFSCKKGQISFLINGKRVSHTAHICSDSKKELFLSKDCLEMKCSIFQSLQKHDLSKYQVVDQNSNPAFKLCKELGFEATMARYHIDGKEYESGICNSKSSSSFVSPSFLLKAFLGT